jgi:hypothetical protein
MASYAWKAIGPAPQHSRSTGLVSGRVLTIAVSTNWNGSNAPALYIGVDGGGAWRSTNFTTAAPFWVPLMDSVVPAARVGAQKVLSIAVDPNRPGPNQPLTMYAAVGDPALCKQTTSFGKTHTMGLSRPPSPGKWMATSPLNTLSFSEWHPLQVTVPL